MFKIKNIEIQNPVVIAPMAGISNTAFRTLVAHYKPGLIYTEMVSDKGIVHGNQKTLDMCKVAPDEHPIALQLFGEDVESMKKYRHLIDDQINSGSLEFFDMSFSLLIEH